MPKKNVKKIIEARKLIERYLEIKEDLKILEEKMKYLENKDEEETLVLLALFDVKIQKRKKYLKELLETKVLVSSNF